EDLAAGGTTILLTTHYMAEAEHLADRVGLLADGKLAAVGSPGELVAEYGGDSRVEIETDADPAARDGTSYRVESKGTDLAIYGVPAAEISTVVADLDRAGIDYDGLTWQQPDLEDVYLAVTERDVDGKTAEDTTIQHAAEREVAQ